MTLADGMFENGDERLASSMAQSLRIPHVVARFLVSRGIRTFTEAHRMLCGNSDDVHDPFLMKGMEEAVAWLLNVREKGEKIFVFGDYDLDGMTAVTLMTRALAELGIESDWRLPNRFGDGYGLSSSAVEEMYQAGARCGKMGGTLQKGRRALRDYRGYGHYRECRNCAGQETGNVDIGD